MAIQRIATSPAELTSFGGTYSTVDTQYDSSRTKGVFMHTELQLSTLQFLPASGNTTWIHFDHAVSRNSASSHQWGGSIFEVKDDQNRRMMYIDMVPNMQWTVRADNGTATEIASQQVLSNSLTFSVDIKIVVGATIDVEVYLNSALQGTASVINSAGITNPDRIQFGVFTNNTGSGGTTGKAWFGEFVVADEDTRGFRLRALTPQSFGVFQQWDGTAASVADASLATGVSTDVADERVSFGLENLDNVGSGDIINRVVVQSYAQRGASGLTSINNFFRYDDTTIQDGSNIALSLTGDWYIDEYTTNPKTAAAWVPDDLAGIQLGVRARV